MSSCYQSYKVLLTNFCHSKNFIFKKWYADMNLFGRSSSRRRSSGASSSDSSARRSYVEPSESSTRDAATKTCLWPCDEYMVCVWALRRNLSNMFTMPSSVPTVQRSATNTSSSPNHFSKDLNSFPVSLGCRLCFMITHILFH